MTQYAQAEQKTAALHTDFARDFVTRRYGPAVASAIYAALPTYSRGPRKGLVKGYVRWLKVNKGGWMRTGPSYYGTPQGKVVTPGARQVEVVLNLETRNEVLSEGFYHEEQSGGQKAQQAREAIGRMVEAMKHARRGW